MKALYSDWEAVKILNEFELSIYDENKHPLISEKAEKTIKEKIVNNKKVLILHNKKGFANQIKCKKCNNTKCYFWTVQTRAGDEAETKFFKCTKCGHTWREYD